MFSLWGWIKHGYLRLADPIADWAVRRGISPNEITSLGTFCAVAAGTAFAMGHIRTGGWMLGLTAVFDVLDGEVARRSGKATPFGAFYDSTLDRISEITVFIGILSLYNDYRLELGDVGMIYWIMLAMAGSLMISYTRARAEALGLDCKVGLMPRAERVVLIGLASLAFGESWNGLVLKIVIVVLAVLTNLTAVQRMVWVYRTAGGVPLDE
jgi:CDP-diacylglycerol--glycerol-3-phosphate 3-phosphatidyltransferase